MEDCEVVFEQSPLYDVLEENSLVSDCEIRSFREKAPSADEVSGGNGVVFASRMLAPMCWDLLRYPWKLLESLFSFRRDDSESSPISHLLSEILQSTALSDDDRSIVVSLAAARHSRHSVICRAASTAPNVGCTLPAASSSNTRPSSLPRSVLHACCTRLCQMQSTWLEHVTGCVPAGATIVVLAGYLAALVVRRQRQRRFARTRHAVKWWLEQLCDACSVVRQSIKYVQEQELIARGYLSLGSGGASVAERVEASSLIVVRQRCPALRMATFKAARRVVLILRELVCAVRSQCVSAAGHDPLLSMLTCVSALPLSEYGSSMTAGSDAELSAATDGLSLSALKAMAGLLDVHCSEYLREVAAALLFDPSPSGSAESVLNAIAPHITDATTGTAFGSRAGVGAIAVEVTQLRRVLTFHSSLSTPNCADECRSRIATDSQFGGSRDYRLLAELGAAVHSTSVHAHAAARAAAALDGFLATVADELRRAPQSLSHATNGVGSSTSAQIASAVSHESVSNLPSGKVATMMTMALQQAPAALAEEVRSQLADVRHAAAASLACCEHGLSLAIEMLDREKTQDSDRGRGGDTSTCEDNDVAADSSDPSLEKDRQRRLLLNAPLTDEFFEAYAADCPEQDASSSDDRDARARSGEAGDAQDANNATAAAAAARVHLLRELKSVVGALAAEWEEREARAAASVRDCRSSAADAAAELCRLADAARAAVEGRDIRKLAADAVAAAAAAAAEVPVETAKVPVESSNVETVATVGDRDGIDATSDALRECDTVVELPSSAAGVGIAAARAPATCADRNRFTDDSDMDLQREQTTVGFDVLDLRRVAAEATRKSLSFRTNFREVTFQDGESDSEPDGVDRFSDSE